MENFVIDKKQEMMNNVESVLGNLEEVHTDEAMLFLFDKTLGSNYEKKIIDYKELALFKTPDIKMFYKNKLAVISTVYRVDGKRENGVRYTNCELHVQIVGKSNNEMSMLSDFRICEVPLEEVLYPENELQRSLGKINNVKFENFDNRDEVYLNCSVEGQRSDETTLLDISKFSLSNKED